MGSNIGTTRCNGRHLHHISIGAVSPDSSTYPHSAINTGQYAAALFICSASKGGEEMMFRSYPDVMTVKQLAAALGIGINKAYEIVNDGTINSKRIGRRILIPKLYLVDYIQQTRYNKGV